MKKAIAILTLLLCASIVAFPQGEDTTTTPAVDWPSIISYIFNGVMLLFSPKLVGVFNKLAQIKELVNEVVDDLADGNLSPSEQKGIAAKFKAVFGKQN